MACLPLFSLPTGRSATRRDIPSSRARRPAIRRCDGPSSSTLHVSRRSGGASVRLLPPCTSVGDPAVLLSASYPCAHQSAIQRCRTPPSPLPPCPGPVHVDWGLPARATRFTTHSRTLGTGFIADGSKRLPRPSSESVGLQSSSAGVRSQALVLLGSLHVELSSWQRGNHPPLQQLAPPPIPVDRVEVSFVLPPTLEKTKHMGATHPCSSAHRHLYSNRSTGGLVRYSKGSVGDHRSRGSNQLLRGARRVRYLQGGCLLRYTGTRVTEQTRPQPPPPVLGVSLQ